MAGLNSDTKILLHFNGNDGDTTTVDTTGRHSTINFNGTAQIDTAVKKFGSSSLLLDGDSDYLRIPSSADFDILDSNSTNRTLDLWVKHDSTSGADMYLSCDGGGANPAWGVNLETNINWVSGQPIIINIFSSTGMDTSWHHLAFIKVGSIYGIYKDGIQIAYLSSSNSGSVPFDLYIGSNGTPASYFHGHLDEIRFQFSNYFAASPNVGLTDTITVPTEEYSLLATPRSQAIIIN